MIVELDEREFRRIVREEMRAYMAAFVVSEEFKQAVYNLPAPNLVMPTASEFLKALAESVQATPELKVTKRGAP